MNTQYYLKIDDSPNNIQNQNKIRFGDFEYVYNKHDGENPFKIEYPKTIKQPKHFFKYYALNKFSVDALTNLYVYATHPSQLNDPFDCDKNLIDVDDKEDIQSLFSPLYNEGLELAQNEEELKSMAQKFSFILMYKKMGILSLAPEWDNLLMWSHYAKHDGFCVEFDTNKFPFLKFGPFPIQYLDNLYTLKTSEIGLPLATLIQATTKQKIWENEHECRLLIASPKGLQMKYYTQYGDEYNRGDEHNRKFRYPLDAIKSFTFGINFFKQENIIELPTEFCYFCDEENLYHKEILDFLFGIQKYIDVYFCKKKGFKLERFKVSIIKISNTKFIITKI